MKLDHIQYAKLQNALRLLNLIEGTADSTSFLDSCETIDKRRIAIREAATEAIRDLEVAFRVHWCLPNGGPKRRDGTPLSRRRRASKRSARA